MKHIVQVTVEGPGGCIAWYMQQIEKMFRDQGHEVVVTDDHPYPVRDNKHMDGWEVQLVANHLPWGG